jgi:Ala-tRNA(Pro) deacylase
MPPFGNLYNLPVYVDRTLTHEPTIFFQAGTHRDTIRIRYADFARLVHPTVVDIARVPGDTKDHFQLDTLDSEIWRFL